MAKRNRTKADNESTKTRINEEDADSTVESVEQRVVAFAEQVGRIVGTVQAKTEGWFDRKALSDQFASLRDSAADMVKHLASRGNAGGEAAGSSPARAQGRSGGVVDAPGKKHRKPMPSTRGAKHSDTRVAKLKVFAESRRRGGGR